ncbi:MAG: tetratricopeptide repeat protein [Bacteroidaceae bacterium]|nr:tetratricopeptide repeat protein [Bacteroidaceae bacterium]
MKKLLGIVGVAFVVAIIISCSASKNTGLSRRVQAFKTQYNTYYNGSEAFKDGYMAQRDGNKDNYMEMLPYYMIANKNTVNLGSGQFDRAIEKSQKAIKQHSITKKPEVSASKRRTAKGKAWLAQKEYNPFLHKAWFLMGNAQFQKGEFFEAASTFAYIQRLYSTKPNIVAKARVLEAKCYAEMDWIYDAEDLIARAERDSFPTSLNGAKAAILADCQIRQQRYEEAIPNVQKAIKRQKGSKEKARLYFLLGQLYHEVGQDEQAFKAFKKVYSKNPPYELEFNARIKQSEVLSKGQSKQMIAKLKRMAKSSKNKDYLDQVYYAIGNIYLANGDTTHALYAYKDGVEKSTRNGIEKGVVWLHLGQLYWDREEFVKAQPCYAGVLSVFDKDRDDYKEVNERSRILDELLPHASAVELQDSLQLLAQMDSVERMKVIKNIIEELKKKEREEEKKAAEAANAARNPQGDPQNPAMQRPGMNNQTPAEWYFYNQTVVQSGKTEFQRLWGQRQLADDWRRNNKTVLALGDEEEEEEEEVDTLAQDIPEELRDSLALTAPTDSTALDSIPQPELSEKEQRELEKQQEYENDPHRPEYYLKDIPFTEEQMAASNAKLMDGLYNSGIIYKDLMENLPLAERTFLRLMTDFPDFEHLDETYYNMYQLYSRFGYSDEAATYREKLMTEYPENEHAKLIADPNFEFKGRFGKQIEDSIYQETYDAYVAEEYNKVISNADYIAQEYPEGANRARFMFLSAMSRLSLGDESQFLNEMKEIVTKYPQSTVSELAGLYVKGLQNGRLLASGRMNNGSIWERRSYLDGEALEGDTLFSEEKNTNWMFVVAYERDSINENQLLFEMAQYNFSNFTIRNFDIEMEKTEGISLLKVKTFLNYDEAYIYLHRLTNNPEMARKMEGLKMFIISEDNMKKLTRGLSYADYFEFYDEVFDRVGKLQFDDDLLDDPQMEIQDPDDLYEMEREAKDDIYDDNDNFIF